MTVRKTKGQIQRNIATSVLQNPGLDIDNPTGILFNLTEGVARAFSNLYTDLDRAEKAASPTKASGSDLDVWAQIFGIRRKRGGQAKSKTAQIFFVQNGTFGDINSGNPIFIQNGSIISSPDDNYVVQISAGKGRPEEGITLNANKSRQEVPVISLNEDPIESIPVGVLTQFNSEFSGLKTRNQVAINSEKAETDQNLRHRLELAMRSFQTANLSSLRLDILSLEGVSNVIERPLTKGPGSIDLLVVGTEGLPANDTIEEVRSVAETNFPGLAIFVSGVETTAISLIVSMSRQDRNLVNNQFRIYLDSLEPGQQFVFNDFANRVGNRISWLDTIVGGESTGTQIVSPGEDTIFVADSSQGSPVIRGSS